VGCSGFECVRSVVRLCTVVTELVGLVALDGTTEIVATANRVGLSSVERGYGESAAVRLLFV